MPKEYILYKMTEWKDQVTRVSKEGMLLSSWIRNPDCIKPDRCGINALNMVNCLYLHLNSGDRRDNGQYPIYILTLTDGRALGFINLSGIVEGPLILDHLPLLVAYREPFELIQEELP